MAITVTNVRWLGQITGSTNAQWPLPVSPLNDPLLVDTGRWWNVLGVDEGANAEHDGNLYFFFGDVDPKGQSLLNSDLVAWTDDHFPRRNGGHQTGTTNYQLPLDTPGASGQSGWRGCHKCAALYFDGDPAHKGVCPMGGPHSPALLEDSFCIPNTSPPKGTPAVGCNWRCCGPCAALFYAGEPAAPCPAGGTHQAAGETFFLPTGSGHLPNTQSNWRCCNYCRELFFDGFADKGLCHAAPGGGIRLLAVTADNKPNSPFDPFRGPEPIGYTGSLETPNGAFSYDGLMHVFAGIASYQYSQRARDTDPPVGQYLFSKANPNQAGPYNIEFLVSPKLGWCATDGTRSEYISHAPAGLHFLLVHDLGQPGWRTGWRSCVNCEAIFLADGHDDAGVCQRGGPHLADPNLPDNFELEVGPDDPAGQNQGNWHACVNCAALYWDGDTSTTLCPAPNHPEGHVADGQSYRVPYSKIDSSHWFTWGQFDWRGCSKCDGLFWAGDGRDGICPLDGKQHLAAGHNFVVPFDSSVNPPAGMYWRICANCEALFLEADGNGACPAAHGAPHAPEGWHFTVPTAATNTDLQWQPGWRVCGKCNGLVYVDPHHPDLGCCPKDGQPHAPATSPDHMMQYNPGVDAHTRDQLRYCINCHGLVRADQGIYFPTTSPVVVQNQRHPLLRNNSGDGVVMVSCDWAHYRLSWMPLHAGQPKKVHFQEIRYYHSGKDMWTDYPDSSPGYELFSSTQPIREPHVCANWIDAAGCWIAVYTQAGDGQTTSPVVARFSTDLRKWSDEVVIFSPIRDHAYGSWMYDPAQPNRVYPASPPTKGFAYGAFPIDRYTTYVQASRTLNLVYVMSTGSPYQVQLMETTITLPNPIV
jgi:hypothetical protein